MKIVHIEDFFHPEAGYQLNILSKYMSKEGHEVFIVTSPMDIMPAYLTDFFGTEKLQEKDELFLKETGVKIIRVPAYKYVSGRTVYRREIFRIVNSLKPDILYVHGNDTLIGIQYILKAHRLNYPIILDSHMLEMASVNKFNKVFRKAYKTVVTPKIIKNDLTIIRTQDDLYVKKALGIPIQNCPWISTGSDTMLFEPDADQKQRFRQSHNIGTDDVIITYVGKLDEAKGGSFLAKAIVDKLKSVKGKNAVFVIVGSTSGEYGQGIEQAFLKSENRIMRFPTQPYTKLAEFYQVADIAIFPKQCSLSFYDAQAAGLPVIAEDNNINIDRLSHHNGLTFKMDDINDFRLKMITLMDKDEKSFNSMKENAYSYVQKEYDYEKITNQYISIITQEIEKFTAQKGRRRK